MPLNYRTQLLPQIDVEITTLMQGIFGCKKEGKKKLEVT